MAFYKNGSQKPKTVKKRTSIGNGLRKRGSLKKRGSKKYVGQGRG